VLLRDLLIFQVKLLLDGMKDVVLMPVTIVAAAIDIVFPGRRPGHRFYMVMALGERFDRWLNLFSASDRADASRDGLLGKGRAGRNTMLSEIEGMLFGHRGAESEPVR
ncbi:MAG: hypothetical protein ACRELT_00730, partial [Longimicrobiales bacterium]